MNKELKKKKADFAKRYGKDAKKVMYATAMKMAKAKNGIESKQFGKMIQQIKSSIENLGQQNEDFNSKIENQLYETPAIANENNINILKEEAEKIIHSAAIIVKESTGIMPILHTREGELITELKKEILKKATLYNEEAKVKKKKTN